MHKLSGPVRTGISRFTLFTRSSICLATLIAGVTASHAALVAYWNFDEASGTNVFDLAGNSSRTNNGFFAPGNEMPARVAGKLGGALGFTWQAPNAPGSGRRVIIPYHTNLTLNGPFTISFWYRMDAPTPAGTFPGIMRIGAQSTTTGNNVGWGFFRTANMTFKRGNNQPALFGAMSVGQWNHLAVRWDGNPTGNNTIAFLNGNQVNFAAVNGWSNVTATTILELGRMDAFDQATLDDLALWGNEAVDAPRLRSLYTVPTFLFLDYDLADMHQLWDAFDNAGTTNVVDGLRWTRTTSLPGSTVLGDAYYNGSSVYVVLGTGAGVTAPLTSIAGQFSPGGVGVVSSVALTESLTISNASLVFDINTNANDLINITGDLSIGDTTISIDPFNVLAPGSYRLINYTGARTGSPTIVNNTRYSLALDESTPGQINLVVGGASATLRWNSTTSGTWDLASSNWFNIDTAAPDRFYQGDAVVFDDSGAYQSNIVVATPVFPSSITVNSTSARNYNLAGLEPIGGVGQGLVKDGNSSLTLSTPNTFVGDVQVNAGVLRLGSGSALGAASGQTIIADGATLDLVGNNQATESFTVQGAGVNGAGAIINTGAALSNNGLRNRVTLAGDTTFGGGARFDVVGGPFQGNGFKLTKVGTPEIALINLGNTGLGDIDIQTGTLTFQGSVGMGDPAKTVTVAGGAALAYWAVGVNVMNKPVVMADGAIMRNGTSGGTDVVTNLAAITLNGNAFFQGGANIALVGGVGGSGSVNKANGGVLYLGGANAYTGRTTISNGRIALLATGTIAASPRVEVLGGTVFDVSRVAGGYSIPTGQTIVGAGSVHGSVTAPAGATLLPGTENVAATLTVTNGLVLSGGTNVFDLAAATTEGSGVNDLISVGGNLDLTGSSSIIVNPLGLLTIGNSYNIISYTGTLVGDASNLTVVNNTRYTVSISTATPGKVTLTVDGGTAGDLFWLGGTPGAETLWDVQGTLNWSDNLGNPSTFFSGDRAFFDDFSLTNVIDIVGTVTPASISIDNGTVDYVFQGGGKLSGNGALTKSFDAKVTIANTAVNDYVGPTTISNGTLQVGIGGAFGNLGSGPITNHGTLIYNRSDNITLGNVLAGNDTGNIIKSNANLMILSAANGGYSGDITAVGGTIRPGTATSLGNAAGSTVIGAGATLDINAQNLADEPVVAAGSGVGGNGAIVNASGTGQNNALRFVTLAGDTTIGGVGRWDIRANPTGALLTGGNDYSLTKVGANQFSLVGIDVDPALGDINVNAGIFAAEVNSGAGNPTNTITIASGATLQFFNRTTPWVKAHVLNGGRNIFSASGVNVMDGPVTLNAPVNIEVAASSLTMNGAIGGSGSLTKIGAGSLWLGADSTYPGNTTISAGPLYLGVGTNAGSVAGPIVNNVTLGIYRSDVFTLTNPYSGSGSINIRSANGVVLGNTTMNVPGTMSVGYTNAGRLIVPEGFTGTWGNLFFGDSPNVPGEMVQLGGAVTITSQIRVGHWPNNTSMLTVGGGTLTQSATPGGVVNPSGVAEQPGVIYLGIDGTGLLVVTGGVVNTHGIVLDGRGNSAGTDTFTLTGGRVNLGASGLKSGSLDANTSYAINLGGGTIGSAASWSSALAMTFTGDGGNTVFDTAGRSNTLTGALGGPGGLTKMGAGALVLSGNALYSGDTTVSGGTLSARGTLGSGSGLVFIDGGTLDGDGTINVGVETVAGGTISPGLSIGRLTINNTLNLGGDVIMEVAKTGATLSNDVLFASGGVTYGGTLTIINVGEPLSSGNTFKLFESPTFAGSFGAFNLPALPAGLAWDTSQLEVDGTVTIGARPLNYAETVLAEEPIAYYRFSDTPPVATNSGALGVAANGAYNGDANVASEAPRPPTFIGFEAENTALTVDGNGDFVQTVDGILNGLTNITLSGWIRRAGAQLDRTGLFGQNDVVEFGYIDNSTLHLWVDNFPTPINVPNPFPDTQWSHVAITLNGTEMQMYTNGFPAGTAPLPSAQYGTSPFPFSIGGGGIFDAITNNGNYFNGQIDEVAVFDKTLTHEQIAAQYFSTVPSAPIIIRQPPAITNVFEGSDLILSVGVVGTAPLSYQWLDSGEPIPNQTGPSLVFSNILESDSRVYSVRITNLYGEAFSAEAEVIVTATQVPTITQEPASATRYAGAPLTLSVAATGSSLLFYQWQKAEADLPGETNATLVFGSLQPSDTGDYRVIVSNSAGSSTSLVATVTVIAPSLPHEQQIVAAGPMAFWRFNETSGTTAFDHFGGNDATYVGGAAPGPEAPRPPQMPGFEADNLAAQFNGTTAYVTGPTGLMNNVSSFTMVGWIRRAGAQNDRTGLFGQNDIIEFGYINNNTLQLWTDGGLDIMPNPFPNAEWSHVAVVGEGNPGTASIYTNGVLAGSRPHVLPAPNAFSFNVGGGGIFDTLAANGNYFNGQVDELAVFDKALSASQVLSLYEAGRNSGAIVLVIERTSGGVVLTWPSGTLQSTEAFVDCLPGAECDPPATVWTDVPGATSPFTVPIGVETTNQFYRVRQ
jgi:autotransporter-associated beta strand protein